MSNQNQLLQLANQALAKENLELKKKIADLSVDLNDVKREYLKLGLEIAKENLESYVDYETSCDNSCSHWVELDWFSAESAIENVIGKLK